jgi:prophage maintenance system killer protein
LQPQGESLVFVILVRLNPHWERRKLHLTVNILWIIFEMAATYLNSIALSHPFFDGNKRTALRQKEEWSAS